MFMIKPSRKIKLLDIIGSEADGDANVSYTLSKFIHNHMRTRFIKSNKIYKRHVRVCRFNSNVLTLNPI